jgi:tRNA modification GTPase
MDLTEVEGLGDLINADTEAQRKQALAAMGGFQRRILDGWRERMTKALA